MDGRLTLIFDSVREQGLPEHFRRADGPFVHARLGAESQTGCGESTELPSRDGLVELRASGSHQPSLSELGGAIAALAPKVVVVDLRQESHVLLGEHPVSWYGTRNWGNRDKTLAEVLADERARIAELSAMLASGQAVEVARVYAKDGAGDLSRVTLEQVRASKVQTEAEAAAGLHLGYERIPVLDHATPTAPEVDRFVELVRGLHGDTWLHFHCHAGEGRTTLFMLFYDMLRNGRRFSLADLAARQWLLGGRELLGTRPGGWKGQLYDERAALVRSFYTYARDADFRSELFSAWRGRLGAS